MLLGIIGILSAAMGLGICLGTGAFGSYMWLWLLPVGFLGGFLVSLGLAFLFLLLVCGPLDPNQTREEDSRFYRTLTNWYIAAILKLLPVRIHTRGLEKIPKTGRFMLVCNHLHEIDPPILLHYFSKSQLAFVSKQENRDMFLVGKIMPMLLCPLINRENDREALKTILRCIKLLKEDKVSVGIFPEGYIHPTRKFQHFRPGVFKIAQKAEVPIVVCTIQNTHNVIKRLMKLKSSDVELHLLDVIPAEQLQGKTTVEIADRVYAMMAQDLGPKNVLEEEST